MVRLIIARSDLLMAAGVLGILALMVVPIPPALLDLMLSLSIAASLVVLMVALYTEEPMEFSVFPGLLLILTLFRLSINVASTRLILGTGNAGSIISAFGDFVVQGNYVVGLVIFLILVLIQFIVITKGAGRIAEVAARFTLDAMPGKQMAIDADLNAGLINEETARTRRDAISREADFYGAMDGASKFVRGDAIAGIVITLINITGGFIIGVAQLGLTVGESAASYTLLTVGDGLVSQIPALLISTAAGIIVTRAGARQNLGKDVASQVVVQPRAMMLATAVLVVFGIIPGLPALPFLVLAAITGVLASAGSSMAQEEIEEKKAEPTDEAKRVEEESEHIEDLLHIDPMELEIGYGLIPLVDKAKGGDLLSRITLIRRQCALELGLVVPLIRIRDNIQLESSDYAIRIRGEELARGKVLMGHLLALDSGLTRGKIEGVETTEPVFGLPAYWIPENKRERAESLGYTVIEVAAVIATHLMEVIKQNASLLVGRQEVRALLENLKKDAPALVEDLVPEPVGHGALLRIIRALLEERVPIRDLGRILESTGEALAGGLEVEAATEHVRQHLGPAISKPLLSGDGSLQVVTLDAMLEQRLVGSLRDMRGGRAIVMEPEAAAEIARAITSVLEGVIAKNHQPILLTSGSLRAPLRRFLIPMIPSIAVLSYLEIPATIEVKAVGTIQTGTNATASVGGGE